MPAAAWAIFTQADMTECTCVGLRRCTSYRTSGLLLSNCQHVFAAWPLCHLYFSHHVVVRLQVHGKGLSHLSLTVVQDVDLHPMFLLALLELNVFNEESFLQKQLKEYPVNALQWLKHGLTL